MMDDLIGTNETVFTSRAFALAGEPRSLRIVSDYQEISRTL